MFGFFEMKWNESLDKSAVITREILSPTTYESNENESDSVISKNQVKFS